MAPVAERQPVSTADDSSGGHPWDTDERDVPHPADRRSPPEALLPLGSTVSVVTAEIASASGDNVLARTIPPAATTPVVQAELAEHPAAECMETIHRLTRRLEDQQRMLEEQRNHTAMLTRLIMQQTQLNAQQTRVNDGLIVDAAPAGTASASAFALADGIVCEEGPALRTATEGETRGAGSETVTADTTQEGSTTSAGASPMACIPRCASSIISSIKRNKLVPRESEVQRVVVKMLRSLPSSKEGQTGNAECDLECDTDQQDNTDDFSGRVAFDPMQLATVIRGMGGTGKSTLAAMVVSRADVLKSFYHGIGWTKLGQRRAPTGASTDSSSAESSTATRNYGTSLDVSRLEEGNRLTFEEYADHLRVLCSQLGVFPPNVDPPLILSHYDASTREQKELRAMQLLRQEMIEMLVGRKCLIVLDDVWHCDDIDWFSFGKGPDSELRVLATTRLKFQTTDASPSGSFLNGNSNTEATSMEDSGVAGEMSVVSLGCLGEEEALRLLYAEAAVGAGADCFVHSVEGQHWPPVEHAHALTIVRCCGCLPVAVRTAGRLLSGTVVDELDGGFTSIEDLAEAMRLNAALHNVVPQISGGGDYAGSSSEQRCRINQSSTALYALCDVFASSFSYQLHGGDVAEMFKMCFAAMAKTFSRLDCARPWVPITAIHMLWKGILRTEEKRLLGNDPNRSFTASLLDKMEALGLVDSADIDPYYGNEGFPGQDSTCPVTPSNPRQRYVRAYRVHHDLMLQYASYCIENDSAQIYERLHYLMALKDSGASGKLWMTKKKVGRKKKAPSQNTIINSINVLFVHTYGITREGEITNVNHRTSFSFWELDDRYMFEHLPHHMIGTNDNRWWKAAFGLLGNKKFLRGRLKYMGVSYGIRKHVQDTETLIAQFRSASRQERKDRHILQEQILRVYEAVGVYLKEHIRGDEMPSMLHGMTWDKKSVASGLFMVGSSLQKQGFMIQSLDRFAEALELYKDAGVRDTDPDVIRTHLYVSNSALPRVVLVPRDSEQCLKVKNPFKFQVRGSNGEEVGKLGVCHDEGDNHKPNSAPLELSSHPGLAIVVWAEFSSLFGMNIQQLSVGPKESALRAYAKGNHVCQSTDGTAIASLRDCLEGDALMLTSLPLTRVPRTGHIFGADFNVSEEDGAISPVGKPELALGIGPFQIVLVARDSPNRFILKHSNDLRSDKLSKVGHEPLNDQEGWPLELVSHPGHAIVLPMKHPINMGKYRTNPLGMGLSKDALRVCYDGRLIANPKDGSVLTVTLDSKGALYYVGSPLFMIRSRKESKTRWKGGVRDFTINEDGSVSPMHAPNVAIGCASLGCANSLLALKEKAQAAKDARLEPKWKKSLHLYHAMDMMTGTILRKDPSKTRADSMFWT